MKKIATILAAIAICFSAYAEEVTLINVHLFDGTKEVYNLPDKPVMRFDGDKLLLESETMTGEYARNAVEKITTERGERQSSIAEVEDADFVFSYDGATVTVTAPSASLYGANGIKILSAVASNGKTTLDLSGLSAGVYVVAPANHQAIKITKK